MHYSYPESGHLLRDTKKFKRPANDFFLIKTSGLRQLRTTASNRETDSQNQGFSELTSRKDQMLDLWVACILPCFFVFSALHNFAINCHPRLWYLPHITYL